MLMQRGYHCIHEPKRPQGEYVVVNTCGFIGDAKQESIEMILQLAEMKARGQIGKLLVMGCLSQRYLSELEEELPEVDKYYGKFNWKQIIDDLPEVTGDKELATNCKPKAYRYTPKHYAYLKISEGCDRHCAYCAIPIITGRHVSRPIEDIVAEVQLLVSEGVKEFQVIAQELTYYGVDLYGKRRIADLVAAIADVPGVEWVRLHYAYPTQFPMELLDVIREKKNVCKYLDIALQHISNHLLKAMQRHVTKEQTIELITQIRERVPGIHLRTTLMVGFPGETEEDFTELLDFVQDMRFERMGAFAYSEEEGTYGAKHYTDDIPQEVKDQRLAKLMRLQQKIGEEVSESKLGQTLKVIIDRKEGDWYIGRSEFSSPEVDPEVLIKADKRLKVGEFYNVKVTNIEDFDLYGEVI